MGRLLEGGRVPLEAGNHLLQAGTQEVGSLLEPGGTLQDIALGSLLEGSRTGIYFDPGSAGSGWT